MNLTPLQVASLQKQIKEQLAKTSLIDFAQFVRDSYTVNWHHGLIAEYLDAVLSGQIKKLMVFVPPQSGKSELVSRLFPSYALGVNPKLKIVCTAFGDSLATSFNRDAQRIIDTDVYHRLFPETVLNGSNVVSNVKGALRNSEIFEIVGYNGFYKTVSVGGQLTGTPVDIGIIDDPVKDVVTATSPTIQKRVFEWYEQVFETRLHNDSRQILTMTRWDKGDLAGRILAHEKKRDGWEVLTLEGIKDRVSHPKDPRKQGEALWESRHSREGMLKKSERTFNALYQQRPDRGVKGLVFPIWHSIAEKEYENLPYDKIYGLDFGFSNDPLALIEVKTGEIEGKQAFFSKELIYNTGITTPMLIIELARLKIDKNAYIYADNARPDTIKELQDAGYNVHPCIKGTIIEGITYMQSFEIYVCEGSTNIASEFYEYKYKEDANGNPLPAVIDKNNHATDSIRYALTTSERKSNDSTTESAVIRRKKTSLLGR